MPAKTYIIRRVGAGVEVVMDPRDPRPRLILYLERTQLREAGVFVTGAPAPVLTLGIEAVGPAAVGAALASAPALSEYMTTPQMQRRLVRAVVDAVKTLKEIAVGERLALGDVVTIISRSSARMGESGQIVDINGRLPRPYSVRFADGRVYTYPRRDIERAYSRQPA